MEKKKISSKKKEMEEEDDDEKRKLCCINDKKGELKECRICSGVATNKSKSFPYAQKILRYGLSKYLYDISYSSSMFFFLLLFEWESLRKNGIENTFTFSSPFCLSLPFYLSFGVQTMQFFLLLYSWSVFFSLYLALSNFSDSNLQQSENCVNTRQKNKKP